MNQEATLEKKVLLETTVDYSSMNYDKYWLCLEGQKVFAYGYQHMDDNYMDWGYTRWEAEVPRRQVEQAMSDALEKGQSKLEVETLVKKEKNNRWGSYGGLEKETTEYHYKIRIEMTKKDGNKLVLMNHFQEQMNIYL